MTTLVLLPGINNTAGTWARTVDALPDGVTGLAVDLPAIGDVDELADLVAADLPERFVPVGHSFGGYVALALLERYPERVAGVVLVNSGTNADSETVAAGRLQKAEKALAGGYQELAAAASARAYHPENADDPQLQAARNQQVTEYGAERFAAHHTACSTRPDRTDLLRSAEVPKLVVVADHDLVIPTERQQAMAVDLGADVRTLGPAGHMLPAEQPVQLAAALAEWVDAHSDTLNPVPTTVQEAQ